MVVAPEEDDRLKFATKDVSSQLSRAQCAACFEDLSRHFTKILRVASVSKSKSAVGLTVQRDDLIFPDQSAPLLRYCGFEEAENYWYLPSKADPRHLHNALESMLVNGPPPADDDLNDEPAHVRELREIRKREYAEKHVPADDSIGTTVLYAPARAGIWVCNRMIALARWIIHGPVMYLLSFVPWVFKIAFKLVREVLHTVTTFPFWVGLAVAMCFLVRICEEKKEKMVCQPPDYFLSIFVWCTKWRETIAGLQQSLIHVAQDIWMEVNSRAYDLQMMALQHPILGRFIYLLLDSFNCLTEMLQFIGVLGTCPLGSADRHVARCRAQAAWQMVEHASSCADLKKYFRRAALVFHGDHINAPGCEREVVEACSVALNVLHDNLVGHLCQ